MELWKDLIALKAIASDQDSHSGSLYNLTDSYYSDS